MYKKNVLCFHGGTFFDAVGNDFSKLHLKNEVIRTDVNDAWFKPAPSILKKVKENAGWLLKNSPPTNSEGLVEAISKFRKLPLENILVDGGSSNLIFTLFLNLFKKGSNVIILDPMYGEYAHVIENLLNAKTTRHKLSKENSFRVELNKLIKQINEVKPDFVVLVNPNSPTGKYLSKEEILKILSSISREIFFVVDETYIDYIGKESSVEREVKKHKNLIVIKSMSKACALSGARVGYLTASESVIKKISPFIPPWAVGTIGQLAGIEALKNKIYYKKKYAQTHKLRKEMIESLKEINSIKVYDSFTNYFMVEIKNKKIKANLVIEELIKKNIFLRNCDSMSLQFNGEFIRIAVKDRKTNQKVVKELKKFFGK